MPLPDTSFVEANLLVSSIYTRRLDRFLDGLPAARVKDLSHVAHRLGCSDILGEIDAAMVRKCGVEPQPAGLRAGWLKASSALPTLVWAQSRGLPKLQLRAAKFVAARHKELVLDGAASEVGENLLLVLRCLQGKA